MKMERLKLYLLVIMILTGLSSCHKPSRSDGAIVDVFVKSISANGQTYFATTYDATGTDAMKSVGVHTPDGVTDSLYAYDAGYLYFYKDPSLALGDFSTTPPTAGTYTFDVKFNDAVEKSFTNELSTSYLLPATIQSVVKAASSNSVTTTWDAVAGAQAYQLLVYNAGNLVFSSQYLDPSSTSVDLPITYISAYQPGTFTFEIDAVSFESDTSSLIQAISASTYNVSL
jgi:hypothetical protein